MTTTEQRVDEPVASPAVAARPRKVHLGQLDLVRFVTFTSVIADHTVLGIWRLTTAPIGMVEIFFRYSRYCFFALTGFVLAFGYRDPTRQLHARTFWRRRFKLIGIPYVTYSLVYWGFGQVTYGSWEQLGDRFSSGADIWTTLCDIAYLLVFGTAFYHMYFLVVTMQIYLIFPLALKVLRWSWGYHRYLLLVSLALHLFVLDRMMSPLFGFMENPVGHFIWNHFATTLLPYQFFVLAGMIAALHFDAFQAALTRWRWLIVAGFLTVAPVTVWYASTKFTSGPEAENLNIERAINVYNPVNVLLFGSLILALYAVGCWSVRGGHGTRRSRFLATAADRSMAVYLLHALALEQIMPLMTDPWSGLPKPAQAVLAFVMTVALTILGVEILRRSPLSLMTTGRPQLRSERPIDPGWFWIGLALLVAGITVRVWDDLGAGTFLAVAGGGLALVYLTQKVGIGERESRLQQESGTRHDESRGTVAPVGTTSE